MLCTNMVKIGSEVLDKIIKICLCIYTVSLHVQCIYLFSQQGHRVKTYTECLLAVGKFYQVFAYTNLIAFFVGDPQVGSLVYQTKGLTIYLLPWSPTLRQSNYIPLACTALLLLLLGKSSAISSLSGLGFSMTCFPFRCLDDDSKKSHVKYNKM